MADKVLNWGLLSTARINRALIPALKASKRNRLTTVASRRLDAAQAYAREWGIARAHGSYEALLADPEVDVIYVPLPNALHAEWSIKALEAGKHVLCEKPLALTVQEADNMAAAAHASGKVLAEALMYMHHPQTRRVKELVDSGKLGRLQLIKGAFTFVLKREGDVRLQSELGGGSIWDVGCYPISFARLVAGAEPEEVFGWKLPANDGVDMTFIGQMRFPDGVLAQFDCGFQTPGRAFIEIAGTEGSLYIPSPFKPGRDERLELRLGDKTEKLIIRGEELYKGEVEDMADAALKGERPRISLEQSRGNIATMVALIESARSGRPVRP
jgi:predicted dehydrogenase